MLLPKEARIGLLAGISLIVFFAGFYFLKGADLFSGERPYTCYFNEVDGLVPATEVQLHGIVVGHVGTVSLTKDKGVKVMLRVSKDVVITTSTTATLASSDLLGGKKIKLDLGNSTTPLAKDESIKGIAATGMMENIGSQITPLVGTLTKTIAALDSVVAGITPIVDQKNRMAIAHTLASLDSTAANVALLSATLKKESGEIAGVIHNANDITTNFAKNNDTVKHILSNLNMLSSQLAKAPIQSTVADLQATTVQIKTLLNKINSNEGSLGALVNNKDLYNNLNSTLGSLDRLLDDLKKHPSKYVNISVFGGKKKK
ncbi:MAG: MCE family protein [Chitinophagia bacterium]|nr:MCE family protein [Chitinophagia bacterium]